MSKKLDREKTMKKLFAVLLALSLSILVLLQFVSVHPRSVTFFNSIALGALVVCVFSATGLFCPRKK